MRQSVPVLASVTVRRSEEHTSELQSLAYLVCRLLLEKKNRVTVRVAALISELLPLTDHAHIFVVQDEDLDRQHILGRGPHLLDVHLDLGVAGHVDDQRFGIAELRADRRREAIAHRAEAARGQPLVGLVEVEVLGLFFFIDTATTHIYTLSLHDALPI